ncbi:MAG: radical SAM protein, partial [Chitinivibrionales bacterium]|nr:radical SAM protein [Chitinivibrionales bacterium]
VYQCSYCDRSVFHRTFRWNSPEYTFELVKYLRRDFGVRHIIFYDDLFTLNRERVARLCTLLREARLGVRYNCIVRIGHIDDELIGLLKSSGCWMVNVGIESGDQAVLDAHKDGLSLNDVRRDVDKLHRAGLHVKGLFMLGFPGETVDSMRKTIELAVSLPLKDANVTAFTPYPGAPITAGIEKSGRFENDWDRMDCEHFVFVSHEAADRAVLERLRADFIGRFYQRPFARKMYRRMLLESPHSYWRLLRNAATYLGYARGLR